MFWKPKERKPSIDPALASAILSGLSGPAHHEGDHTWLINCITWSVIIGLCGGAWLMFKPTHKIGTMEEEKVSADVLDTSKYTVDDALDRIQVYRPAKFLWVLPNPFHDDKTSALWVGVIQRTAPNQLAMIQPADVQAYTETAGTAEQKVQHFEQTHAPIIKLPPDKPASTILTAESWNDKAKKAGEGADKLVAESQKEHPIHTQATIDRAKQHGVRIDP